MKIRAQVRKQQQNGFVSLYTSIWYLSTFSSPDGVHIEVEVESQLRTNSGFQWISNALNSIFSCLLQIVW